MYRIIKIILFSFIVLALVSCSSVNKNLSDSLHNDNYINIDDTIDNKIVDEEEIKVFEFKQIDAPIYDEKVYKLNVDSYGGFNGVDNNYFYLAYSRDNYTEYIRYNKNNKEIPEIMYKTDNIYGTVFSEVYQEKLYIIEVHLGDPSYEFQVVQIDENKDKIIIYKFNSINFPEVARVNNNIVFTYDSVSEGVENQMPIISVNMDSHESKQIDIAYNTELDDFNLNGYITRCLGGIDNLLYYTKIYFENEAPIGEDDGTVFLYRYSYDDDAITEICILDKVPTYISGGKNFFFTSDYSPNDGSAKIGSFYYIHENGDISKQLVPGIEPTKHIRGVYRINEELIMLGSNENIYLYNLKKHEYFMTKYIKPQENYLTSYQRPIFFNNTIGYLVNRNGDDEVFYYEILLEDLISK